MRIILIRHGETYANDLFNSEDRILIGALDTEIAQLNEKGKRQAIEAKKQLENIQIDEIYSSDLGRTIETTSLVFPNREFNTTPLLRERTLGSDEGLTFKEVFSREGVWNYHVNSEFDSIEECMNKKVIDGECFQEALDRCNKFLEQFDFNENKTIAIVGHFHLFRFMIYTLLNKQPDKDLFKMMIPNASPMIFEYQDKRFTHVE